MIVGCSNCECFIPESIYEQIKVDYEDLMKLKNSNNIKIKIDTSNCTQEGANELKEYFRKIFSND